MISCSGGLMEENSNWKKPIMLIGGVGGLLVGLAAAYLYIRSKEEGDIERKFTSSQGMKIGLGVVSLLKQIADGGPR